MTRKEVISSIRGKRVRHRQKKGKAKVSAIFTSRRLGIYNLLRVPITSPRQHLIWGFSCCRIFDAGTIFQFDVVGEGEESNNFLFRTDLSRATDYQYHLNKIYADITSAGFQKSDALRTIKLLFHKILEFQSEYEMEKKNKVSRSTLIPEVQLVPTPSNPFVFLHHEKTAGSSLRRYITRASKDNAHKFYVPCFDRDAIYHEDLRCYSFDLKNATEDNGGIVGELSVMGGHFPWNVWLDNQPGSIPSCFVMMRQPIERAISLYYERVFPREDFGETFINDWDLEDWKWLLKEFKGSAWGMYRDEGMCNTMCMMLLDR